MNFWFTVLRQLGRNLRQTWGVQIMTRAENYPV